MNELVKIRDLNIKFHTYEGVVQALNGFNLDIMQNETLGIVGETGCGKTVTALSILRLVLPPGKIESGNIFFAPNEGSDEYIDILALNDAEIRKIRGSKISMVFQEPSTALNPVFTIGNQIGEVALLHQRPKVACSAVETLDDLLKNDSGILASLLRPLRRVQRRLLSMIAEKRHVYIPNIILTIPLAKHFLWRLEDEANKVAIKMLKEVEIPDAERVVKMHPHQLSGGMKQRAVIAMALACSHRLLVADEPTTALDVTIQAQILKLLARLKEEYKSSILYITHDLGVAAELCDRIAVMYSGSLCENADVVELFKNPQHPYTQALLAAVPKPGYEPKAIGGSVPNPLDPPTGCRFHPRCPKTMDICKECVPEIKEVKPGHFVACHLY